MKKTFEFESKRNAILIGLGTGRGFISIDSEWLCLNFRDGVVIEAVIRKD